MGKASSEAVYFISHVAKICNIHPQTLRQYEKEGFIKPSRSEGGVRLYSLDDIDKINEILHLTRDLGINLSGINMIMELKNKIVELEERIEYFESITNCSTSRALVEKKNYEVIVVDEI